MHKIFLYSLLSLFLFYLNIILSFSLLYLLLDYLQYGPIIDHFANTNDPVYWNDKLMRSIYFSAITMMSVGYGDLSPFGWSRTVAVIEAMIGYVLPPALVIKYILFPSKPLLKLLNRHTNEKYHP